MKTGMGRVRLKDGYSLNCKLTPGGKDQLDRLVAWFQGRVDAGIQVTASDVTRFALDFLDSNKDKVQTERVGAECVNP